VNTGCGGGGLVVVCTWCFRAPVESGVTRFAPRAEVTGYTVAADFVSVRANFATRRETENNRKPVGR